MVSREKKKKVLCVADMSDPSYLSLYTSFEVDFVHTLNEARSLLFSKCFDMVVLDYTFWPEESMALVTIVEKLCPWLPILALYTEETQHTARGSTYDGLRPMNKDGLSLRLDDLAMGVMIDSERKIAERSGKVSAVFMEQYDDLVRATGALYHQADLLPRLDEFTEEVVTIFPDVVATALSVRQSSAVICANFPLSVATLAVLKDELLSVYKEMAGRPLGTNQLDVDFRGKIHRGSEAGKSIRLDPATVTPLLERGQLAGLLMLSRVSKGDQGNDPARYGAKHCAKHLHEAFLLYNEIRNKAIVDPLSGVYNYGFLCEHLKRLWERSRRHLSSIALLMVDIDQSKRINDSYGHLVGDAVIRDVARMAGLVVKQDDIVARYRGDEFVLVLSDNEGDRAAEVAKSLLDLVRKHVFEDVGFSLRLTVSIGVAVSNVLNEKDETQLLEFASRAVMLAKRSGRNQVCDARELESRVDDRRLEGVRGAGEGEQAASHILVVDDEETVRNAIAILCKQWGYKVTTAATAREAIELVQSGTGGVDVVLTDIMMPEMNGIEMAQALLTIDPDIVTVAVTGHGTAENAIQALRAGVYNFIQKPFSVNAMELVVKRAVERRQMKKQATEHRLHLENLLQERTQALQSNVAALKGSYLETIERIVSIFDVFGPLGTEHHRRVSEFSVLLATRMGIDDKELLGTIRHAGLLHDIGKLGVPADILTCSGSLSPEQTDRLNNHVVLGYNIVRSIPILEEVADLIYAHHERVNGSGYPGGLKGDQIPLGARVLAVADAFDVMRFDRAGRKGLSLREVVENINKVSGKWFDLAVVKVFNNSYKELDQLFMEQSKFWENMAFGHPYEIKTEAVSKGVKVKKVAR